MSTGEAPFRVVRRVGGEVVVIVFSILLAFALDAAWDERQRAAEVTEVLNGLEAEFSTYRADLERIHARWDSIGGEIETLLLAIHERRELPLEQLRASTWALLWPSTYDPGSGVRDALIASGRLELIESEALRRSLVGWEGVLREVQDNELWMRDFILNQLTPYLASRHVPLGALSLGPGRSWTGMSIDQEAASYRDVMADPEFMALAVTRYAWLEAGLPEYRLASDFASQVLEQIHAESRRY